jgi:hypothetical protein
MDGCERPERYCAQAIELLIVTIRGQKVPWQEFARDFQDETFRFQVLDEGEYKDRDWRDDLKMLLEYRV